MYDLREGWARYRVVPVPVECFVIDDAFSFAFQNLENCALGAARRTTTFSPGRSAPSPFTLKRPYRFSGLNLLTASSPALAALQQATRTVPIVFVNVIDPVGSGFVDSLTRPSGNTTGFLLFEYSLSGKWLELLKQIAPNVTRAAVFRDTGNPSGNAQFGAIQAVAPSLGIEVSPINMRDASEIERAAAEVIRAQPRPPRDAVHKMATELENYGPPRFQGGVRAIRATLSRKGSTV